MTGILGGLIGSFSSGYNSDFELIASYTSQVNETVNISFSNIPQNYSYLYIIATPILPTVSSGTHRIRFNNVATSSYFGGGFLAANTAGSSIEYTSSTQLPTVEMASGGALHLVKVDMYNNSTLNKPYQAESFNVASAGLGLRRRSGIINIIGELNSMQISTSAQTVAGSMFSLYGVK